jgi:hypothetical protein
MSEVNHTVPAMTRRPLVRPQRPNLRGIFLDEHRAIADRRGPQTFGSWLVLCEEAPPPGHNGPSGIAPWFTGAPNVPPEPLWVWLAVKVMGSLARSGLWKTRAEIKAWLGMVYSWWRPFPSGMVIDESPRSPRRAALPSPAPVAADAPASPAANLEREDEVIAFLNAALDRHDDKQVRVRMSPALRFFAPGGALAHLRIQREPWCEEVSADALVGTWTTAHDGHWKHEIEYVLDHAVLRPADYDALLISLAQLIRYGASSATVREIALLEEAEIRKRRARLAAALGPQALPLSAKDLETVREWLRRDPPPVLSFADWHALQLVRGDLCAYLWLFGPALGVCDHCLDQMDTAAHSDRRRWALLAAAVGFQKTPDVALLLASTPPRITMPDEQATYKQLLANSDFRRVFDLGLYFVFASESRGDSAGAMRLRTVLDYASDTGTIGF